MSTHTEYPTTVTKHAATIAALESMPSVNIEYTHIDPAQCDHCAMVGAIVEARVYGPTDAATVLYAECCLDCAHGVAQFHTEQGDEDITVEINAEA